MLDRTERRILDQTARQLRAEDPGLADRLRGRPARYRPARLGVACLGVLVLVLFLAGHPAQAFVLAVVVGALGYRLRRAGGTRADPFRAPPENSRDR